MTQRASGYAAIVASLALVSALVSAGPAAAETTTRPAPPTNLRVTDLTPSTITVAWDPVSGATQYSLALIPQEPFGGGYRRTDTTGLQMTFSNLAWDLLYKATVRAYVPSAYPNSWTDTTAVTVRTLLPEGYQAPSMPANIRVERDADGMISQIAWDPATGTAGPFTYRVHLASPEQPWIDGIWVFTSETSIPGSAIPFNDGIVAPGETLTLFVTATDQVPKVSPPSHSLSFLCCPM